ncbi:MAG: hypothetical protein ACR2IS_18350 [Nitrososphaeraceae archaeon]
MSDALTIEIQTRREYIESLINDFGSGQIAQEKFIGELAEEFSKSYSIIQTQNSEISQLKDRYELLINIIISMPEVQNNPSLTDKIKKFYPEDSHP